MLGISGGEIQHIVYCIHADNNIWCQHIGETRKFRSMRVDAEKDGVARLSTGDNDDRITPVGSL